jgi:hypothetical protein
MLSVIAMFQKLRLYAHAHPGLERHREEFDALMDVLRKHYNVPSDPGGS